MDIAGHSIGMAHRPFVIAEMSGNHNRSFERALEIVEAAATAGAHAVKLQTYTADTLTLDVDSPDFRIDDPASLWNGRSLHELYAEASTPWEWHERIFNRCRNLGVVCFSTPFDETAVDLLESLAAPCYKIASFEIVHLPLIRRVAQTGKPLLISTGMATEAEIEEAVDTVRREGNQNIVLLKCTSTYPASPDDTDLATIPHMRERFGCEVGISDHTLGVGASVAAVALGATVVEKHFTLSRAEGGVDSAFSLEPSELRALVEETERGWRAVGSVRYGATERERASLNFRRSLYVAEDMRAGDVFTPRNLRAVRPGFGLPPKYYDQLIGRAVVRDVSRGTPMTWDLVE
ncbi:MAG: pseudaminic acid synthase [Thermoleophilia bacterium]